MNYDLILLVGYVFSGAVFTVWLLWVLYVFVMSLKRVREQGLLSNTALVCGSALAVPAVVIDVAVNITIRTVLFLDIPREWTLSSRLSRYWEGEPCWRRSISAWIATALLNPFDPSGKHIH